MHRTIAVLIASLALVLVVRSDDVLKCYMCTSLTHQGCDNDPKAHNIEPSECTLNDMVILQRVVQQHGTLSKISSIFDVDNSQHYQANAPMACAKMVLQVNKQEVTVRNCQIAKTETIDPCKAIQGKYSNDIFNVNFCDLCMHDACNDSTAPSPRMFVTLLFVLSITIFSSFYNVA